MNGRWPLGANGKAARSRQGDQVEESWRSPVTGSTARTADWFTRIRELLLAGSTGTMKKKGPRGG
jgi:hypothetical protein